MKLYATSNLVLPFYLYASSVATLNVGGETYVSEKKANLQLLMQSPSHNKLPPAVEFGLTRKLTHMNQQNVRHAEEEVVYTPCMNDLLESFDVQLEYAVAIFFEALSALTICSEDGTSCTEDWSNVDLSAGEDVCKQNDMELYIIDAEMDGCLSIKDDFSFNTTYEDYKYSENDNPLYTADSIKIIDFPLGCMPASCEKEEIEELFLSIEDLFLSPEELFLSPEELFLSPYKSSYQSCETTLIKSLYLFGEDPSSSSSGNMNPFRRSKAMRMSLMIAGIIGAYA